MIFHEYHVLNVLVQYFIVKYSIYFYVALTPFNDIEFNKYDNFLITASVSIFTLIGNYSSSIINL